MSNDDTHNGWTNRETWAVALHINNDQGWQESVLDDVRNSRDGYLMDDPEEPYRPWQAGEVIRENVEETLTGETVQRHDGTHGVWYSLTEGQLMAQREIGSLWRVNWDELGASFLSDLDES